MQRWESDFGRRRVTIARPAPPKGRWAALTLCPGPLAGAVVAFGLAADRKGSMVSPTFRAFGWIAERSDTAEG